MNRFTFMRVGLGVAAAAVVAMLGACGQFGDDFRPVFSFDGYSASDEMADPIERGKAQFASRQYGLAIRSFSVALTGDKRSIPALNGIAASYDMLGRFDVADKFYNRALLIEPRSATVLNNVGYSHLMRGDRETGERFLKLAASIDSKNPIVQVNLMLALGEPEADPLLVQANLPAPNSSDSMASEAEAASRAASSDQPRHRVRLVRIARGVQALLTRPDSTVEQLMMPRSSGSVAEIGRIERVPSVVPREIRVETAAKIENEIPSSANLEELVIEVSNGTGRDGMAARMLDHFATLGISADWLSNDVTFSNAHSRIVCRPAAREQASAVAELLPFEVPIESDDSQRADIRLVLGSDRLGFDRKLFARANGGSNG